MANYRGKQLPYKMSTNRTSILCCLGPNLYCQSSTMYYLKVTQFSSIVACVPKSLRREGLELHVTTTESQTPFPICT